MLDLRLTARLGPDDGHDIEPAALLQQAVALQEVESRERQPALFRVRDFFGRCAAPARLDLHKDERIAIASD
jgi:hypothetical protein